MPKTPLDVAETGDRALAQDTGTVTAARADITRLGRIVAVLTRHGFHQFVKRRRLLGFLGKAFIPADDEELLAVDQPGMAAVRFRKVLSELGPTFIKLGQVLSTRPDLLPAEFVRELERLQDDAPPLPVEQIKQKIESELGIPLTEAFAHFEEEPLASASIGQVHRARTHDGDEVVVKVVRPGVNELIEADLDLLHLMARILEATFQEMELYAPGELVETFDKALKRELDLSEEADVLEEFAQNMADLDDLAIPRVFRDLCGKQVLTIEFFKANKLTSVEPGSPMAKKLVKVGLESTFRQIFDNGLFHGDPHPGNMLVLDDGRFGLIDFGLVGRLTPPQQDVLVTLLVSVIAGDIDGIARVVLRMGRPLGRIDMRALKETIATIRETHLRRSLAEVDASQFVQDLLQAGQRFRIRITPEFAILAKASVTTEGVLRAIDPELDIVATARPFATRLIQRRFSYRRLAGMGVSGLMAVTSLVRDAPEQVDQLLMDLNSGQLRFQFQNDKLEEVGNHINVLTTRLSMALIAAALFISAAVLVPHDPWHWLGVPWATTIALLVAVFLSVVGLGWHAVGAGSGKISLNFLVKLVRRRRRVEH